ncbi:MAG: methyltransferase domain-containing protein [Anaerolineales bacterium]
MASIPDASQDFVIANHLLEHCQNPIGALENWLRVLHMDGVLFLSIPDKRYTFDYSRPITDLNHVVRDWREGPAWSRKQHFEEWARLVERVSVEQIQRRADTLAQSNASIHFHVWTAEAIRELLGYCQRNLKHDFEVVLFVRNGIENIAILKRLGRDSV